MRLSEADEKRIESILRFSKNGMPGNVWTIPPTWLEDQFEKQHLPLLFETTKEYLEQHRSGIDVIWTGKHFLLKATSKTD